jgi:hypothetical protein
LAARPGHYLSRNRLAADDAAIFAGEPEWSGRSRRPLMTEPAMIAKNYIALWNEADQTCRKELIAKAWTEDATYIDPMMAGRGHDEIDALIGAVHQRFPGHRFELSGQPDGHSDRIRFSWTLGAPASEPIAHGTDFGIVAGDGRLKAITGFLDHVKA